MSRPRKRTRRQPEYIPEIPGVDEQTCVILWGKGVVCLREVPLGEKVHGIEARARFEKLGPAKILEIFIERGDEQQSIKCSPDQVFFVCPSFTARLASSLVPGDVLETRMMRLYDQGFPSCRTGVQHGIGYLNCFKNAVCISAQNVTDLVPHFDGFESNTDPVNGFVKILNVPKFFSKLPEISSDYKYMRGFLQGYFAATGKISLRGKIILAASTTSRDSLVSMLLLCGIGCSSAKIKGSWRIMLWPETIPPEFFIRREDAMRFAAMDLTTYPLGWTVLSVKDTGKVEKVYSFRGKDYDTSKKGMTMRNGIVLASSRTEVEGITFVGPAPRE